MGAAVYLLMGGLCIYLKGKAEYFKRHLDGWDTAGFIKRGTWGRG